MQHIYRLSSIIVLLVLVISGLNISNQGINSLTLDNRGPVIGLKLGTDNINMQFLSQNYEYSREKIRREWQFFKEESKIIIHQGINYINKIWRILTVLFPL